MAWGDGDPVVGAPDVAVPQMASADVNPYDVLNASVAAPSVSATSPFTYGPNNPGPISADGVSLVPLVQHLETGGTRDAANAVSSAGAVGIMQIEPKTAELYGFDPSRLKDPAYNQVVGSTILQDLSQKYKGDIDAVLVSYNASPKVMDRWLASGRDPNALPAETRNYLANAHAYLGLPDQTATSPTWGASDPVAKTSWGANDPVAPTWGANDPVAKPGIGDYFKSAIGGAIQEGAQVLKGLGQIGDVVAQGQLAEQAGEAQGITPQQREELYKGGQTPNTLVSAHVSSVAASVAAAGQSLEPSNPTKGERIASAAGGFVPLLASGAAAPLTFAAQAYNEAFDASIKAGRTPQQAQDAALQNGAVQAAIGALPVGELAKVAEGLKGIVKVAAETGIHAGSGAAINTASQVASNINAKLNYNPDQDVFEGVPQAVETGALAGGGLHVATSAYGAAKGAVAARLRPRETVPTQEGEASVSQMPATDAVQRYINGGEATPEGTPAGQTPEVAWGKEDAVVQPSTWTPDRKAQFQAQYAPISPEATEIAAEVPAPMLQQAAADVDEYRSAAPKGQTIFQAIKDLGGMRVKEPDGSPTAGPDVQGALEDVKNKPPGMINNKSGMSPEQMHEALADAGWFGQGNIDDEALVDAIRQQTSGEPFLHPQDEAGDQLARRHMLDHDMGQAGVQPSDDPMLAAAKLADWRNNVQQQGSLDMEALRARADTLGILYAPHTLHDELLGDVIEREAIQGEPTRDDLNAHERDIHGELTQADVERLHTLASEGLTAEHGASPSAYPLPGGWEFEPSPPEGYSEPATSTGSGGEGEAQAASEAAALATPNRSALKFAREGVFYSAAQRAIDNNSTKAATPDQWKATLDNASGVKKEELDWTGVKDWLDLFPKGERVPKEAVSAFLRDHGVQVKEVLLGEHRLPDAPPDAQAVAEHQAEWNRLTQAIAPLREQITHSLYEAKSGPERDAVRTALDDARARADTLEAERDRLHQQMVDETNARSGYGGHAQFSDWKTPGGSDYHELLLTLPDVSNPPATHWDTPGVMAHVRFDTRTDADGKKVLFVQEVQSDWHQKGRDQGYAQSASVAEREAAASAESSARKTYQEKIADIRNYIADAKSLEPYYAGVKANLGINSDYDLRELAGAHVLNVTRELIDVGRKPFSGTREEANALGDTLAKLLDLRNAAKSAELRLNEASQRRNQAEGRGGIPNAPFKSSWPALVMKRVITWAADHGYQRVAWTTGDQQAERYSLSHALGTVDATRLPDGRVRFAIGNGRRDARMALQEHGEASGGDTIMTRSQALEAFGHDAGARMFDGATAHTPKRFEGEDLHVGGSGMRAFYDRNLVNITNDLIKKYGAKVGGVQMEHPELGKLKDAARFAETDLQRTLERHQRINPRIMEDDPDLAILSNRRIRHARAQAELREANKGLSQHGFDITDKMREAATNGFPLFARNEDQANPETSSGLRETPRGPVNAKTEALINKVEAAVRRMAPFAEVRADKALHDGAGNSLRGASFREDGKHIIAWALGVDDPMGVARHEAIHALRTAGMFTKDEWAALAHEAVSDGWLDRYRIGRRYADQSPEVQIEEAIADRFAEWRRSGLEGFPSFVREAFTRLQQFLDHVADLTRRAFGQNATASDIFSRVERGEQAGRQMADAGNGAVRFSRQDDERQRKGPHGVFNRILGQGAESVGRKLVTTADRSIPDPVSELLDAVKMGVSPMGSGSERAQASAKDFANALRQSAFQWGKLDEWLQKNFTPEQRQAMWTAADEHGVILRRGQEPGPNEGLNRLTSKERETILALQEKADAAFADAKRLGMVSSEGLESYVPRMIIEMTVAGPKVVSKASPKQAKRGANLSTTTGQLRQRKYETVEETEAAAKQAFGDKAMVVRDIRTLGLATQRLEQAVAGRTLVDKIKAMSKDAEVPLAKDGGGNPDPGAYFTLEHPALQTWQPKMVQEEETGKWTPAVDQNGDTVFEAHPVWISKEFEGPLKAVLSSPSGGVTRALMDLKAKMMSIIMYSPLMHNAVIWGKAIPADPKGVLTLMAYRRGNLARKDPGVMQEAIAAGMDPIGHRYFNQDIAGIAAAEGLNMTPGRSWTSQVLGYIPGLFDKNAGDAVKSAIDKFGDVWHNTFLWDRIADLQVGLYIHIRDGLLAKGVDPMAAQRTAAHFANRYAGAMPMESMSKMARTTANMLLFSRSFTLGNMAAYKDIVMGLPSDVRAQIVRDGGMKVLEGVQGVARQKALGMLIMDVALSHLGLILAAGATAWLTKTAFQAPWHNEQGKENRFLIGYQPDGTAVYGRLPTGKVGEELTDWILDPRDILLRKLSPYGRLAYEMASNDKGFGQKLYDPYDHTPTGYAKNVGRVAWEAVGGMAPESQIQGLRDMFTGGQNRKTAALEAFAPLAGLTISKGAPGGPAMSDLFAVRDEQGFRWQEGRQDVVRQIKEGDIAGARQRMTALGVTPALQGYYVRTALNPQARLSRREIQDFLASATPDQKAQFAADRAAMAQRARVAPTP